MAATGHELHWNGQTGSRGRKGNTYAAVYRVYTNSPLDGPKTVTDYLESQGVVWVGRTYAYGNDIDPDSICDGIAPSYADNTRTVWEVVCSFNPPAGPFEGSKAQDPLLYDLSGKPITNPLLRPSRLEMGKTTIQVPAWQCKYISGFKGISAGIWHKGDLVVPSNSAFVPFDPPLEKPLTLSTFRHTKNFAYWDGLIEKAYRDTINSDFVVINSVAYKLSTSWEPYTALLTSFGGSFHLEDGVRYWERTLEFLINPEGWDDLIPDRGVIELFKAGEKLPTGEFVSAGDLPGQTLGIPIQRKDPEGVPLTDPVLFDGDGHALENPSPANIVWLRYRKYLREAAFAPLGLSL